MPDIFLYSGEAAPNDVRLRDPTVAGAGDPEIFGTLSVTDDADTLVGAVVVAVDATLAATDATDALSAAAAAQIDASAVLSDAADSLSGAAAVAVAAALDGTDAADTLAAVAEGQAAPGSSQSGGGHSRAESWVHVPRRYVAPAVVASAALVDAGDTVAARGAVLSFAQARAVDDADQAAATGGVVILAAFRVTDASDTLFSAPPISDDELLVYLMAA